MKARIVASSVLAALSLGFAQVAMAEDTETLETLSRDLSGLTCDGKEGRTVGQCISDVLKRIKGIEFAFADWYKKEVAEWHKEHDGAGISREYTVELKQFNDMMQERRKWFHEQVREVRKMFFDQQNIVRVQKGSVNTTGSRTLNTDGEKEALKSCNEKFASDNDAERVCLRNLLQRKEAVERRLRPIRARVEQEKQNAAELPKRPLR